MRARVKGLSKRRFVTPYYFALVYAGLGERDRAFDWLERAYQLHDGRLCFLKVEPYLDGLSRDPRFASLARRVGL